MVSAHYSTLCTV